MRNTMNMTMRMRKLIAMAVMAVTIIGCAGVLTGCGGRTGVCENCGNETIVKDYTVIMFGFEKDGTFCDNCAEEVEMIVGSDNISRK